MKKKKKLILKPTKKKRTELSPLEKLQTRYHSIPETRPDVSITKNLGKIFKMSSVKCKLNTLTRNKHITDMIENTVLNMHRMKLLASQLINYHFTRLLESNEPLTPIDRNLFYRALTSISTLNGELTDQEKIHISLKQSVINFRINMPDQFQYPSRDKYVSILNNMSRNMLVEAENHLNLNFEGRFKKYLKFYHEIDDVWRAKYIVDHVFQRRKVDPEHPSTFDNDPKNEELIQIYQEQFEHPKSDTSIVKKAQIFLPFLYQVLQEFELKDELAKTEAEKKEQKEQTKQKTKKEIKKFNIMPVSSMTPGHILICSTSLGQLLSKWYGRPVKDYTLKGRVVVGLETWLKYFPGLSSHLKNKKKIFHSEISTNGYEAVIHFHTYPKYFSIQDWNEYDDEEKVIHSNVMVDKINLHEKLKLAFQNGKIKLKDERKKLKVVKDLDYRVNKLIEMLEKEDLEKIGDMEQYLDWIDQRLDINKCVSLGADTGQRSLFTAKSNQSDEIIRCTGKEYRHRTDQKKNMRRINRRKDEINVVNELCEYSLKVSSSKTFLDSLKEINSRLDVILYEYYKKFYRRIKFSSFIKKQKTLNMLGERLKNGHKEIILGWGNGCQSCSGLKGNRMPVKSVGEYLRHHKGINLTSIDEYNTTKKCYNCGWKTVEIKHWIEKETLNGKKIFKGQIYGLRRCPNSECGISWDRDVNACENILFLLINKIQGLCRPEYLCKKQSEKPLRSIKVVAVTDQSSNNDPVISLPGVTPDENGKFDFPNIYSKSIANIKKI